MTTALAATVGTGNIAGVTGAIAAGGPGAVFWMWVSALVGMVTKYAEVVLAIRYRERNEKGDWVGGSMYYIRNGLGRKWSWLAVMFSLLGALAAFGIAIMTTIQKGVGRGVFSNEAGLGSAPMAHAASSETDPVKQGLYCIFEVFMDTIVICTLTALTLLCGVESGVEIAWGTSGGAELELELVWDIADTLNGFMAIPNLVALLGLSGVVIKLPRSILQRISCPHKRNQWYMGAVFVNVTSGCAIVLPGWLRFGDRFDNIATKGGGPYDHR